ncbi:MAG: Maf family protein, partial [Candidatus Eremiobacteraeota bacterium]|nr:Maf family protein [Candidatus Eremiobacteraeota bacterium]
MILSRIILASASPRRLELLRSIGLDVEVVPSTYAEPAIEHLSPRDLAIAHAREKALDVFSRRTDLPIVASDTVVDVDGVAYGKPTDARDAERMLRTLSTRMHTVHTAFTFLDHKSSTDVAGIESTSVRFFPLSDEEISSYVASREPMDKAGAYGIQGIGATLVERIDGDFYT